jgi:hypothetical protein
VLLLDSLCARDESVVDWVQWCSSASGGCSSVLVAAVQLAVSTHILALMASFPGLASHFFCCFFSAQRRPVDEHSAGLVQDCFTGLVSVSWQ